MNSTAKDLKKSKEQIIYSIAAKMSETGLPPKFVKRSVDLAFEYDGIFDLFVLWQEEDNIEEKNQIIADIEEHVEDIQSYEPSTQHKTKLPKINFDEIELIGTDIF